MVLRRIIKEQNTDSLLSIGPRPQSLAPSLSSSILVFVHRHWHLSSVVLLWLVMDDAKSDLVGRDERRDAGVVSQVTEGKIIR
jgi:type IV secretory pathway TrbD component